MGYTIREGFTNQDAWVVSIADALGNNSALLTATASDLILGAGLGLLFPSGTNGICGTATLAAGTVTISTNQVTANSVILITRRSPAGTAGTLYAVSAISAGVSFTITAYTSGTTVANLDTSTVSWFIIN
jgi:hypothetical protein